MTKRAAELALVRERYGETEASCKRIAPPSTPTKLAPPLYIASVKELANTSSTRASACATGFDSAIIRRIRKCLERANHTGTVEAEAKAALYLASRLMGQYNVLQADVLSHEPPATQRQYAGQSVVSIKRTDGDRSKAMKHQSYVDGLCHAMERFFDCKSYSTTNLFALELTFYGITENTAAAAMAFKMVYNLISEWARPYKGVGCKNSYCLGVSDELSRMANREKATEEAEAKRAEREGIATKKKAVDRQLQIGPPAPHLEASNKSATPEPADATSSIDNESPPPPYDASSITWSDWVADGLGDGADPEFTENASESAEDSVEPDVKVEDEYSGSIIENLDEDMRKFIKLENLSSEASLRMHSQLPPHTTSLELTLPPGCDLAIKMEPMSGTLSGPDKVRGSEWVSHMQLVIFRAAAAKIADDYVEEKGIKIHHQSARRTVIHNRAAYSQGVKDSKKIDVHRRRIEE